MDTENREEEEEPVCKHQIAVREGRDDRSCLTRPHSQARPWTRKTCFPVPLMTRRVADQTAVDPCLAEHADRTNLSRSLWPRDRRFHDAVAEIGRNPVNKHQIQPDMEISRLTRDGTAERGQGNIHFPCPADHEQDWQPYPVDPYYCYM